MGEHRHIIGGAMKPKEEHDHTHIVGIIASPCGLQVGYERDTKLFAEYGGMKFDYCPICGRKNQEG